MAEVWRQRIKAGALLKQLQAHAEGKLDLTIIRKVGHSNGLKSTSETYAVDQSRIDVSLALLDKVIPSLKTTALEGGDPAKPVKVSIGWRRS